MDPQQAREIVPTLLKDADFAVTVNGLKAIRQHRLEGFEKELIQLLLDDSSEVKVAAIRTLASFGDPRHYQLVRTFFEENPGARSLIIDSFVNYSDTFETYPFMMQKLTDADEKVRQAAETWYEKAFRHDPTKHPRNPQYTILVLWLLR